MRYYVVRLPSISMDMLSVSTSVAALLNLTTPIRQMLYEQVFTTLPEFDKPSSQWSD